MRFIWTAGGAVTLTWSGPNHCRGIKHPCRRSMCNITHMHTHDTHTHAVMQRWYVASRSKGSAESVSQTLDTRTYLSISLSACYWNEEWLITVQHTYLLSDFWLICEDQHAAAQGFPVVKLLVYCQLWYFGVFTSWQLAKSSLFKALTQTHSVVWYGWIFFGFQVDLLRAMCGR